MKLYIVAALAFFAMLTGGCRHGDAHADHDHEHEDKLQLTGYSDTFEVFAEATPLVAGEECEVLAHFTLLSDFKPLEKGKVTATLKVGGSTATQTLDAPEHPGIYRFKLKPEKAGNAVMTFDVASPQGSSRIVIDGLKVYSDEHEAHHAAHEAAAESSNAVSFTKEMSWKVDFATEAAEPRNIGQVIHTMAQVEPSQGDVRTVAAKSSGVVLFASADLTDGRAVGAGQSLFRIDASGMADNNLRVKFLEAKSNYDIAKREYERKGELAKDRLVTESDLLRAKNEYENAKAVYDNLSKGFSGGGSVVTSPLSGFITQLLVSNGQYVEAGQPLATVAQNRDLYIKAEVQPSYFPHLASIRGANIRRPNGEEMYSLSDLGGSVVSYGKSVDASNPLIPVVFRVNNAAGLLPGSFVEMYISTGDGSNALTVPQSALIEEMGNYFVYVQLTPEYFEKREVKTGRCDGRYTEILGGLKGGERVVSKGAVLVKLAHASGTLDAHSGHVH